MRIVICALAAGLAAPVFAQTPASAPTQPSNVTVNSAGGDVRETLRTIAKQSGARVLIGTEVTGKLTLNLSNITFEGALGVIAKTAGLRWSRIAVPADKADALTADQASAAVSAADALKAAGVLQIQGAGTGLVSVGAPMPAPAGSLDVYLVQTKVDPAAIKAARDEARKRAADKDEAAREGAIAQTLSPDVRKDLGLVKAYTAVQSLQPDQIALLMREFMTHSTPQQMMQIGDAIQRHNIPLDGSRPQ